MSIFGTNQVEEVIIGSAVASEATVAAFIATASDKEIKALALDGGTAAEGKLFYLLQKTGGDAGKGLNYEFSDRINPKKIERITLREYAPEVQKSVQVTGFTVQENKTYAINIRLYNESGSLSTENFRIISGYYSTGSDVTGVTVVDIIDGLVANLNTELVSRGDSEFVVTKDATSITIAGKYQEGNPDKGFGRQIQFDLTTKVINQQGENIGGLDVTVLEPGFVGTGTGKQVVAKEWFAKGFKYSPYRGMDYPAGFDTPMQADRAGQYNAIIITYKSSRISPTVEEQQKVLLIYVDNDAATNAVLADIRVFVGANGVDVPADLSLV